MVDTERSAQPAARSEAADGPTAGDAAPDADLLALGGRPVALASFWADQPVVLVFLRYFGCPFCQIQVASLCRDESRVREVGGQVVLVGHGSPGSAEAFSARKRLPFPLLMDPWRDAYRAYGLGRGSMNQVLGPRVLPQSIRRGLAKETRQGGLQGGDLMQMPGTFVIDTGGVIRGHDGVVRLAHRNEHVADAPSNDAIVDLLRSLSAKGS
ncbi:MAG: peroxiredoxin-like family protein [Actinomycetota bacterium]